MSDTLYLKEKRALLKAALPDAIFDGFTDGLVAKAAQSAGLTEHQAVLAFPDGGIDLAVFFIREGTRTMKTQLAALDLPSMKIRARITIAVLTRLEVDTKHREAARRAFNLLASPRHAPQAAYLLGETVDAMWRAAGDTSTDGNFYSKRAILSGVYTSTRLKWFNDDSVEIKQTKAFLDRRIENVMQIEIGKAKYRAFKEKLPNPFEVLAKWRFGRGKGTAESARDKGV